MQAIFGLQVTSSPPTWPPVSMSFESFGNGYKLNTLTRIYVGIANFNPKATVNFMMNDPSQSYPRINSMTVPAVEKNFV